MTTTRDRERLDADAMNTQRMDNSVAPVTGASRDGGAAGRVFLATDDARYITGACLVVDGGVLVQQRSTPVDTFPLDRFPKL